MDNHIQDEPTPLEISNEDVIEAMKSIRGYIDITPGDFRKVYRAAYSLAIRRLLATLKAEDIMSGPVLTIDREVQLVQAAATLAEKNISGAPVTDTDGKVIGVVSEKDFLREMGMGASPSFMQIANHCLNDKSCMIGKLRQRTVADIMTRPAVTAGPELTVREIAALFTEKKINRLPVVSDTGHAIGIVTRTDLARAYIILGKKVTK